MLFVIPSNDEARHLEIIRQQYCAGYHRVAIYRIYVTEEKAYLKSDVNQKLFNQKGDRYEKVHCSIDGRLFTRARRLFAESSAAQADGKP